MRTAKDLEREADRSEDESVQQRETAMPAEIGESHGELLLESKTCPQISLA